jgi:hypothetical protein
MSDAEQQDYGKWLDDFLSRRGPAQRYDDEAAIAAVLKACRMAGTTIGDSFFTKGADVEVFVRGTACEVHVYMKNGGVLIFDGALRSADPPKRRKRRGRE